MVSLDRVIGVYADLASACIALSEPRSELSELLSRAEPPVR